ncbi:hypothetical protein V6N13_130756 [Hibiscus sabdariffa]|uniref:Uncharacterized protein n=1 Tax=Hibiscus sabdariffa TaxID=183260 RepID=A0ABR2BPE0_9ROSI
MEVDVASQTNSDIARKQSITRSARNAKVLGKHVGIEFIGDENEILEVFIRAKMQDSLVVVAQSFEVCEIHRSFMELERRIVELEVLRNEASLNIEKLAYSGMP